MGVHSLSSIVNSNVLTKPPGTFLLSASKAQTEKQSATLTLNQVDAYLNKLGKKYDGFSLIRYKEHLYKEIFKTQTQAGSNNKNYVHFIKNGDTWEIDTKSLAGLIQNDIWETRNGEKVYKDDSEDSHFYKGTAQQKGIFSEQNLIENYNATFPNAKISAPSPMKNSNMLIGQFLNENKEDIGNFQKSLKAIVVDGKSYDGQMNGKLFQDAQGNSMIILYGTGYPPPWDSQVFKYKDGKFEKGLSLGRSGILPGGSVEEDIKTKSVFDLNAATDIILTWPNSESEKETYRAYRKALNEKADYKNFSLRQIDFSQSTKARNNSSNFAVASRWVPLSLSLA